MVGASSLGRRCSLLFSGENRSLIVCERGIAGAGASDTLGTSGDSCADGACTWGAGGIACIAGTAMGADASSLVGIVGDGTFAKSAGAGCTPCAPSLMIGGASAMGAGAPCEATGNGIARGATYAPPPALSLLDESGWSAGAATGAATGEATGEATGAITGTLCCTVCVCGCGALGCGAVDSVLGAALGTGGRCSSRARRGFMSRSVAR